MLLEEMEKRELQTGGEVAAGEGMEGEVEEGKREMLTAATGVARGEIVKKGVQVLRREDGEGRRGLEERLLLH